MLLILAELQREALERAHLGQCLLFESMWGHDEDD